MNYAFTLTPTEKVFAFEAMREEERREEERIRRVVGETMGRLFGGGRG